MEIGSVASWVGVGVSLVFSITAFVVSLLALRWHRVGAQAADRSANAAEKAQAIAEANWAAFKEQEAASMITWDLERPGKTQFLLRNTGWVTATGVTVDGEQAGEAARERPTNATVRPDESVELRMYGTLGAPMPNEIWVSWDRHPEPVAVPVPPW